jgi:hypothetical protein
VAVLADARHDLGDASAVVDGGERVVAALAGGDGRGERCDVPVPHAYPGVAWREACSCVV